MATCSTTTAGSSRLPTLVKRLFRWVEDRHLSDLGEITELVLATATATDGIYRIRYAYLDGTPIAGSSTFTVTPIAPDRCRFTATFEYQEQELSTVLLFGCEGLKLHNGVLRAQVKGSAALLGAPILASDVL